MSEPTVVIFAPPKLPPEPDLHLVRAMDRIRDAHMTDEEFEFHWFAREYPRIFRHHANHAYHRLRANHARYVAAQADLANTLAELDTSEGEPLSIGGSNIDTMTLYWDFESQLQAIGSALDTLARIAALECRRDAPTTFSRLAKYKATPVSDLFETERQGWVEEFKAYRDCFVHYTPVDTLLFLTHYRTEGGWRTRCKLPSNPSSKHIVWFKYDYRKRDVLSYGIYVLGRLWAFERRLASYIEASHEAGTFPKRWDGLHRLGS